MSERRWTEGLPWSGGLSHRLGDWEVRNLNVGLDNIRSFFRLKLSIFNTFLIKIVHFQYYIFNQKIENDRLNVDITIKIVKIKWKCQIPLKLMTKLSKSVENVKFLFKFDELSIKFKFEFKIWICFNRIHRDNMNSD